MVVVHSCRGLQDQALFYNACRTESTTHSIAMVRSGKKRKKVTLINLVIGKSPGETLRKCGSRAYTNEAQKLLCFSCCDYKSKWRSTPSPAWLYSRSLADYSPNMLPSIRGSYLALRTACNRPLLPAFPAAPIASHPLRPGTATACGPTLFQSFW